MREGDNRLNEGNIENTIFRKPSIGKLKTYFPKSNSEEVENAMTFLLGESQVSLPEKVGFVIYTENFIDLCIWKRKGNSNLSRTLYGLNPNSQFQQLPKEANPCTQIQKDIISFETGIWTQNSNKDMNKYLEKFYGEQK